VSKKRAQRVLVKPTAAADPATTKAIDDLRKEVQGRSFADGSRLLEGVELAAGINRFAHGLGRRPKGYLVVGARNASVSERRIVAPTGGQENVVASLTLPSGTTDYWTYTGTARVHYPLPVISGETITAIECYFYRGAGVGDPTLRLLAASTGASASVISPTVAWTNPSADTTWQLLAASYDTEFNLNHATLDVASAANSRVRQAFVTVSKPGMVPLTDEHDSHTDTDTFLYLGAAGLTATVDLLVF
jgi:hypothetical protein